MNDWRPSPLILVTVFLSVWLVIVCGLDRYTQPMFDEFYYVKAIKERLIQGYDTNFEHPPLAKQIMTSGAQLLGDSPHGWRISSSFFASIAIVVIALCAALLYGPKAFYIAIIMSLANSWFLFFGRLAMLDIFFISFAWISIFSWLIWRLYKLPQSLWLAGLFMGFAIGCKWQAALVAFVIFGFTLFQQIRKSAQFLIAAFIGYFVCYVPYFFMSFEGFHIQNWPQWQLAILQTHTTETAQNASAMKWHEWFFHFKPIVFSFLKESSARTGYVYPTFMIVNPIYQIAGYVAVLYYLITRRDQSSLFVTLLFLFPVLVWWPLPRSNTYFHYFFFSSTVLVFPLTRAMNNAIFRRPKNERTIRYMGILFLAGLCLIALYLYPVQTGVEFSAPTFSRYYSIFNRQ